MSFYVSNKIYIYVYSEMLSEKNREEYVEKEKRLW